MLVDGDEDSMAMYAIGLLGMGFQPFTAGNAEEAYARARDLHPHVVVADVALPAALAWNSRANCVKTLRPATPPSLSSPVVRLRP